uniref:Uncharacterized protein n=1 Tax=Plectus sambesii TaxID=2011161 RepID=A0A914WHL7_9BILA
MHTSRRQCFDANNTRFKCCCGIHVKNGALLVSIVTFLTFGIILIDNINYYGNINNGSGNLWSSIAGLTIAGVVCALLLYGVCYARAAFLMPYLIIQGIAITVYTLGTVICFIGVVSDNQLAHDFADKWAYDNGDTSERGVSLIAFFVLLIQLLFQVWFFSVVYRCHVFFRLQCAH